MKKNEIVIVVPVYKEWLDSTEKISLEQLYRVLGIYNICFVAPKKMHSFFEKNNLKYICFDDKFFINTSTYSELLLSDFFYKNFSAYEYMLIYQLDAFVFRDELLEFCDLGYDYIGAPVPRNCCNEWRTIKARVGNGGFSLRKIASVRRVIADISRICNEKLIKDLCYKYEDLFFSYCGVRKDIDFSVPDVKTALKFAVDDDVSHSYQKLGEALPFGCHRWSKNERYLIWRPYVSKDEAVLSELDTYFTGKMDVDYRYLQWENVTPYIINRFSLYNPERLRKLLYSNIDLEQSYIIWGYGKYGVILHKLLKQFNYNVVQILDTNKKQNELDEIPVTTPNMDELKCGNNFIIIAATGHDKIIRDELLRSGIPSNRVIVCRELLEKIVSEYVSNLVNNNLSYQDMILTSIK